MLTELDEWANMTDVSDEDSAASGAEGRHTYSGHFHRLKFAVKRYQCTLSLYR